MNGFIGEIRYFAGNFAPRNWAFCEGQLMSISQNTALFSILGTIYGGDGRTTFALPDMRGRVALGSGQGPGLTNRREGARFGTENNTITNLNLPAHNHIGTISGEIKPNVRAEEDNSTDDPSDAFYNQKGNDFYSDTPAPGENSGALTSDLGFTVNNNGGGQQINNRQPLLAVYYIICLTGTFPSRN